MRADERLRFFFLIGRIGQSRTSYRRAASARRRHAAQREPTLSHSYNSPYAAKGDTHEAERLLVSSRAIPRQETEPGYSLCLLVLRPSGAHAYAISALLC